MSVKTNIVSNMTPCSDVETYRRFRYVFCLPSQEQGLSSGKLIHFYEPTHDVTFPEDSNILARTKQ
jgi:hypothetical protein